MVNQNFNSNLNTLLEGGEVYQRKMVVYLTCSLSLFFSILFWRSFGEGFAEQAMLVAMAFALEGTKLTSLNQLKEKKKVVALIVFFTLSAVSVIGSSVVLQERIFEQNKLANSQDWYQQEIKNEIERRQNQINLLSQSANKDIENGFRARANKTLKSINLEEEKISELRLNLKVESGKSGSKLNLVFSFFGNEGSGNEERFLILFLGTLLEICTSYLLLSVSRERSQVQFQERSQVRPGTKKIEARNGVPEKNRSPGATFSQVQNQERKNSVSLGAKRSEKVVSLTLVKNSLSKGECKPTTRAVKEHFSVGTEKARNLLGNLVDEGVLSLVGNRYQLCG